MIVLAIDPGVRACAFALLETGCLCAVYFGGAEKSRWLCQRIPDRVIVERPEYQGARSDAARTGDLIDLAWAGARAAYAIGAPVEEYTPGEWKGSEAKPPQHLRLWEDCLTPEERKLFPAETGKRINMAAEKYALKPGKPGASYYGRWDGHNLLDAAAFGLAYVGRFR